MGAIAFEILFILVLICANGVFSGSEIAVVSARKIRLEQLAREGSRGAHLALRLANAPSDFLSTVQIGITLIGILSGALGGATLAERLGVLLDLVPLFRPYRDLLSLVLVVTVITYLSLVVGELLPKRIALNSPEAIACAIAPPMRGLSRLTAPVVHVLGVSTDGLLHLLGIRASQDPPVTEEEIKALIRQGTQAGLFEEAEHEMVRRVFRLGDRPIRALMTPRKDIDWLDINAPIDETRRQIMDSPYSRFPVCEGELDDCRGIVRVRSLLSTYLAGQPLDLSTLLQAPLYVAETTRALRILEIFRESGTHIALVTNEYGGIEGLVTLNDLMEAIVGELPSAESAEEPMVIQREDGSWLLDGLLPIDNFKDLFGKETLPEEESGTYHTLAGFIITFLDRIPMSGDGFQWENLRIEVVDMDGTRVDKVLVYSLAEPEPSEESTSFT